MRVAILIVCAMAMTARADEQRPELLFVFRAGDATYVRLADLELGLPKHGPAKLFEDAHGTAAVAGVQPADVPRPYRELRGTRMRVDAACTAKVVGFAVVARLAGDPAYAGIEDPAWTARSVMARGARVLAAQLDGCTGSYARGVTQPNVVRPIRIADDELANAARSVVLASSVAADAQREWNRVGLPGDWFDHVDLVTTVIRHPTTEVTWVTVHGVYTEADCSGPDINVWGLLRVRRDRTLEVVDVRNLGILYTIEHVIDHDGDGDFELLGRTWIGVDTVLVDAAGEHELDRLASAFFGCAC
jgi:hypothetical protein